MEKADSIPNNHLTSFHQYIQPQQECVVYCKKYGTKQQTTAKFCQNCGELLHKLN